MQIQLERYIPWDLLISHLKKETNPEEEQRLSAWRTINANESLYREITSLWYEITKDAVSYHPDTDYYWKQMEARIEKMGKRKKTLSIPLRKVRMAIAAASVLLVMAVSTSYFMTKSYFQPDRSIQTYKALNGKSQVTLPDGSIVRLNIGSTLTFESSFMTDRRVKLDGEALFDVQKDSKHPFVVSAGDLKVNVYGTRFSVDVNSSGENIKVALLNGEVTVSAGKQELIMNPGDIVSFNKNTLFLSKTEGDVTFEAFWADNSYTFEAKQLSYICKYLERWYNVEIELDPTIADSQVYTFTITDEPLETILQIMSRINPIRYSFEENKRVIVKNVPPTKIMPMK